MADKFTENLPQYVAALSSSYRTYPYTTPQISEQLPSRDEIIEITELLRQLIFPRYFGKQNLNDGSIEYHIGNLMVTIGERLRVQICRALRHKQDRGDALGEDGIADEADEICCRFFSALPAVRAILWTDIQATFDGDPAAYDTDEVIFSYPGIIAISIYRLAHELYTLSVPLIPRIMSEYAHSVTGIDINSGAKIGEYFFIDHGTGIVIGETTEIGRNVKIYQGVTLGALSTRGGQSLRNKKRHPTIEDDVTVYSGASIFGGETVIGKGAVIGSNVFITQSIPAGTKVSIKNPDLRYKGGEAQKPDPADWSI